MARERFDFIVRLRDRFTTGLRRLKRETNDVLTTLGKITGVSALVGAGLAALSGVKVFSVGLRSAIDFEEQMKAVQAVSGATSEEFDRLSQKADALGASTRFTATEAAQGLEELVRAGQNAGEAIDTIGSALNVAQANSIEVADAATLVTTTLNQFQKEAREAANVADLLTRGTQVSAQNIEQLGKALEFAGPQAKAAGLTLDETIGIIGRLADVGFRGEKGGTALRNALIKLEDPTSKFREELRKLGISSDNFLDVLDQLAEKGSDSEAALLTLGDRAGPAIATLVSQGTGDLRQLIATLQDAEGTAARTAAEMDNNLSGALKGLSSAFDAFARSTVKPILEPLTNGVRTLTARIRELASSPAFEQATERFGELVDRGVQLFADFIGSINFDALFSRIGEFVNQASSSLQTFGRNVASVSAFASKSLAVLGLVFNTVRTGIETLVAGIAKSLQLTGDLLGFILRIYDKVPLVDLENQIKSIGDASDLAGQIASRALDNAGQSADKVAAAIKKLGDEQESAGPKVERVNEALAETEDAGEAAADGLQTAGDAADAAAPQLDNVADAAAGAAGAMGDLSDAQEAAATGSDLQGRYDALIDRLGQLAREGKGASEESRQLQQELQSLDRQMDRSAEKTEGLSQAYQNLSVTSASALENAKNAAVSAFDQIVEAARRGEASQQDINNAFASLADTYRSAGEGADEFTQRQIEAELQVLAGVNGVTDGYQRQGDAGKEAGERAADGANAAADAAERTREAAEEAADGIKRVAEEAGATATAVGSQIGSIIAGWHALGDNVSAEVDRLLEKITVRGGSLGAFLQKLGAGLQDLQAQLQENQDRADAALERFNTGVDELGNGIRAVRNDFVLLDDVTLDKLDDAILQANENLTQFLGNLNEGIQSARDELAELEGETVDRELRRTEARIRELEQLLTETFDPRARALLVEELAIQQRIADARRSTAESEQSIKKDRETNARLAEAEKTSPRRAEVTLRIANELDPNADRLQLTESQVQEIAGRVIGAIQGQGESVSG